MCGETKRRVGWICEGRVGVGGGLVGKGEGVTTCFLSEPAFMV